MFGNQMFAGPHRDNGTQRGVLATDFARFLPVYTPSSSCSHLWWWLPSWNRSSNHTLWVVLGKVQVSSWVFWGLDYFQLQIIHMPKRHFGVANFVPLQKQIPDIGTFFPGNKSSHIYTSLNDKHLKQILLIFTSDLDIIIMPVPLESYSKLIWKLTNWMFDWFISLCYIRKHIRILLSMT